MNKKIIGVVVLAFSIGMVTFADEIAEILNIDLLGEKAVETSVRLEASQLTLDNKELDLEEANKDAINANQIGGDRVTYINNMIKVNSDTLIAEMNVELAKMSLAKEEEELKSNIRKKGMNYILSEKNIAHNQKLLEYKNSYKEFAATRLDKGVATSTDLTNKTIDVQSQELKILELTSGFEGLKIEINHLIGKDLNDELNLEDELKVYTFMEMNVGEIYEARVDKFTDVYTKSETLKSKVIIFDLYADKYLETNKEYKTALYNKQIAEIEYEEAKKTFEVSLRTSYNNYVNNYKTYKLTVKQAELSNKLYDDAKLKYELGLISQEALLNAEEAKLNSDYSVESAIYNFNVSRIDFDDLY